MTKGRVAMYCLIAAEAAMFTIFVVAYLFYAGKGVGGMVDGRRVAVPETNLSSGHEAVRRCDASARGECAAQCEAWEALDQSGSVNHAAAC